MSPTTPPPSATTHASRLQPRADEGIEDLLQRLECLVTARHRAARLGARACPPRLLASRARYSGATVRVGDDQHVAAVMCRPSSGAFPAILPDHDRVAALAQIDVAALVRHGGAGRRRAPRDRHHSAASLALSPPATFCTPSWRRIVLRPRTDLAAVGFDDDFSGLDVQRRTRLASARASVPRGSALCSSGRSALRRVRASCCSTEVRR